MATTADTMQFGRYAVSRLYDAVIDELDMIGYSDYDEVLLDEDSGFARIETEDPRFGARVTVTVELHQPEGV